MNNLRLLAYLPNIKSYQDRVFLFDKIAQNTQKALLLVSKKDMDTDKLGIKHIEIIEVPQNKSFFGKSFLRVSSYAKKLIASESINIVHETFGHLLGLFYFKNKFKNTVFITSQYILAKYDWDHYFMPNYGLIKALKFNDLRFWILRLFMQRWICYTADAVIVQAPGLVTRLIESYPFCNDKTYWFPNNIEEDLWAKTNNISNKNNAFVQLLYVGGFSTAKGCDVLLDFILKCREMNFPVKAVCVGGMAEIDSVYFNNKINKLNLRNEVRFIKKIDKLELQKYYEESDYLFHASFVDGSPRVIYESLCNGLPVIGSNHPGIKIIDPENKFIIFLNKYKFEFLMDEIKKDLMNNRENYNNRRINGKNYVLDNFTSLTISKKYNELYEKLLAEKNIS